MARRPNQLYTALRPDADGNPIGGGYSCGACGLEGLAFGEPHYRASGVICEPHPDGAEVITYAPASAGGLAIRHQGGAPVSGTAATPLHPDFVNDLARLTPAERNEIHEQLKATIADNTVATAAAKGEVDGAGQRIDAAHSAEQLVAATEPTGDNTVIGGGPTVTPPPPPAVPFVASSGEATDPSFPPSFDTTPVTAAPNLPPGGPVAGEPGPV